MIFTLTFAFFQKPFLRSGNCTSVRFAKVYVASINYFYMKIGTYSQRKKVSSHFKLCFRLKAIKSSLSTIVLLIYGHEAENQAS